MAIASKGVYILLLMCIMCFCAVKQLITITVVFLKKDSHTAVLWFSVNQLFVLLTDMEVGSWANVSVSV